jgi:hypothetical protein
MYYWLITLTVLHYCIFFTNIKLNACSIVKIDPSYICTNLLTNSFKLE